jgi:hypothetical protein
MMWNLGRGTRLSTDASVNRVLTPPLNHGKKKASQR